MRRCLQIFVTGFLLGAGSLALAQQDGARSGPQAGELIPGAFHPFNVTGTHPDRPHCLVCQYGLHPVAALFARELPSPDGPLMKLLQGLDAAIEKNPSSDLHSFVVYLNDDSQNIDLRRPLAKRLRDLSDAAKLKNAVLSLDSAAGPKDWKLNKETDVTVLLYAKHKVQASFAFPKDALNDKGIESILAAVQKLAPAKKK